MTYASTVAKPVNYLRLTLIFCGAAFALSLIVMLITMLLNFEAPAMGVIIAFAATQAAMQDFVKQHARVPEKGERAKFATFAAVCLTILSLAFAGVIDSLSGGTVLGELIRDAAGSGVSAPLVYAFLFAVSLSVIWLVAYFASGATSRWAMKAADAAAKKAKGV
jgi:hypothetical protein